MSSTSLHSPLLLLPPKHPKIPIISSPPAYTGLRITHPLLSRTLTLAPKPSPFPIPSSSSSSSSVVVAAGRSKKDKKGAGGGRIEGGGDVRREAKANARRRSRRLAENLFYRRRKLAGGGGGGNGADSFTEEELEMIGLGYDRSVRFMSGPDDPRLRHPHDWHKYGSFGPYSWRGVVVGPPLRGRFSDDRATLIGEVRDHEEWDRIEQFEMAAQFSRRLADLDASSVGGLRYFWVFVRHPKWRPSELPWRQWTLVAEVAVEAGKQQQQQQRIDKWSLMGRLGNRTRAMVTQCAAWMRPDVVYVKRPVYQCRFEPQDGFFRPLGPLLDPGTESNYLFELDGAPCTYFGGLCRMVRISPKAYVDDVVNAYEKLGEDAKSRCLEFLLTNHPTELLHPYTKEWKVRLEETELGCDAPDEDESESERDDGAQITDWIEDDEETNGGDDDDDDEEEDNAVIDVGAEEEEEEEEEEEGVVERDPEESEEYWNEQWKKAVSSSEEMEKLVRRSVEASTEYYKSQMREKKEREERMGEEKAASVRVVEPVQSKAEWENEEYRSRKRRVKSKIPPELFLRAAVRPFTYRNLVKEIVLMRHAIIDGDISGKG